MSHRYTELDNEALLHIEGPDASKFAQGQFTCDLRQLSEQQALLGAYCNPQGRMVCDFLLAQPGADHLVLRMRADIVDQAASVIGKYILFSKAEIIQPPTWRCFGLWGEGAGSWVAQQAGNELAEPLASVAFGNGAIVRVPGEDARFECYLPADAAEDFVAALAENGEAGTRSEWELGSIVAGMARIEAPTVEEFIPQMLNYDLSGHVSFTKGCYTGQEVVARMHYRGKPKRRLYRATVVATAPEAGTALFSAAASQAVGNIINAVPEADGAQVLFNATEAGLEQGLHLESIEGPDLELLPLPANLQPATD